MEDNNNFLLLEEYFKNNALLYQQTYSTLFPKYFCRVDNYGIKSKWTFEVAHAGYQIPAGNFTFCAVATACCHCQTGAKLNSR